MCLRIIFLYSEINQPFLAEIDSWKDEAFIYMGIKNWKRRLEQSGTLGIVVRENDYVCEVGRKQA